MRCRGVHVSPHWLLSEPRRVLAMTSFSLRHKSRFSLYFGVIILLFGVVSILVAHPRASFQNDLHGPPPAPLESRLRESVQSSVVKPNTILQKRLSVATLSETHSSVPDHQIAGLSCDRFGGPSKEQSQEMVYWEDIPKDANFISPLKHPSQEQYITFEPDQGYVCPRSTLECQCLRAIVDSSSDTASTRSLTQSQSAPQGI